MAARSVDAAAGGDGRFVLGVFAASRLLTLAAAAAAQALKPHPRPLGEVLGTWDVGWYMSIVTQGYAFFPNGHREGDAANWAFFPLLPLCIRLLSQVTGLNPAVAGHLLANLCFGLALALLLRYSSAFCDRATSRFITTFAAFSPLSVYFAVPYTEAPYLLLMLAAMLCAANGRWLAAGLSAAALSATRNLGVMLVFPLLAVAVRQHGWRALVTLRPGTERVLTALCLAPLGLFLYMLFLYLRTGDALAFMHIQLAWGRDPGNPLLVAFRALAQGGWGNRVGALTGLAGLATAAWLWLRGLRPEALILCFGVLIPLSTAADSMARYTLTLYPMFLALGLLTVARPRLRTPLLICAALLDCFAVASWMAGMGYMI